MSNLKELEKTLSDKKTSVTAFEAMLHCQNSMIKQLKMMASLVIDYDMYGTAKEMLQVIEHLGLITDDVKSKLSFQKDETARLEAQVQMEKAKDGIIVAGDQ